MPLSEHGLHGLQLVSTQYEGREEEGRPGAVQVQVRCRSRCGCTQFQLSFFFFGICHCLVSATVCGAARLVDPFG